MLPGTLPLPSNLHSFLRFLIFLASPPRAPPSTNQILISVLVKKAIPLSVPFLITEKIADKRNLQEGGFFGFTGAGDSAYSEVKGCKMGAGGGWSHSIQLGNREQCSVFFLLSLESKTQTQGIVLPNLRLGPPTSINLI